MHRTVEHTADMDGDVKLDIKEKWGEEIGWVYPMQDMAHGRTFRSRVMKFQVREGR
jgi:hypothetical protein